ncbi:hypothetical protein DFQ26_000823 [Actinomortierella ambigua]|nr:hypothetical protein DFQ26_000823 [Actinomortierella ambigua]
MAATTFTVHLLTSLVSYRILYTDIVSGDELFTDGFPVTEVEGAYEIACEMVQVGKGVDVDIGANPSIEGDEDEQHSEVITVNNVVATFRLQQVSYDKKSYTTYLKGYLKALEVELKGTNPSRVEGFNQEAAALFQKVLDDFESYEFYRGESMDPEAMVMLLRYRSDGTPYFTAFKDGVKAERCNVTSQVSTSSQHPSPSILKRKFYAADLASFRAPENLQIGRTLGAKA